MFHQSCKCVILTFVLLVIFFLGIIGYVECSQKGIGILASKSAANSSLNNSFNRYAVIVGVSKYKHSPLNLQYSARDAKAFYDFLLTPAGGRFNRKNIRLLLDEDATSSALRSALGTFLSGTSADDHIIIYFSGHGSPTPSNPEDIYLLTHEADPSDLAGTAFPMDEVKRYLKKSIKAKRVVVFVDTCYSGGIQLMGVGVQPSSNSLARYLAKLSESRQGMVSITASGASQVSVEDSKYGYGHGVFTYYLLKALTDDALIADIDDNGIVDVAEAYEYVREKVKRETGGRQIPDKNGNLSVGIPLAVVLGHEPQRGNDKINITFGMFRESTGNQLEKVKPGDILYSGQGYFFYVHAERSCYLYLFQKDSTGAVYRLFPNSDYDTPVNPAVGGKKLLLPNANEVFYLDHNSGKEEIILFASTEKIQKFEMINTGSLSDIEIDGFQLMGPAGVRKRKESIGHVRLNSGRVVDELQASGKFLFKMTFMHK